MIRFWRHLKAAWLYYRVAPYIDAADEEKFWTEEDAQNLERFFSSYTGRKLKMRLTNFTMASACNAVNAGGNYARNTGVAAGIAIGIGHIEEHYPFGVTHNAEEANDEETAIEALAREQAA